MGRAPRGEREAMSARFGAGKAPSTRQAARRASCGRGVAGQRTTAAGCGRPARVTNRRRGARAPSFRPPAAQVDGVGRSGGGAPRRSPAVAPTCSSSEGMIFTDPSSGCSHTCDQSTPNKSTSSCSRCMVARCLRRSSLTDTSSAPSRKPPRQPPVRSRPELGRPGRPRG